MKIFSKKRKGGKSSSSDSHKQVTKPTIGERPLLNILLCCSSCERNGITDLCSGLNASKLQTNTDDWQSSEDVIRYVERHSKSPHAKLLQTTAEKKPDSPLRRADSCRKKKPAPPPPTQVTTSSTPATNIDDVSSSETSISTSTCESPPKNADNVSSSCILPALTMDLFRSMALTGSSPKPQQTENKTCRKTLSPYPHRTIPLYQPRERSIQEPTSKNQLSDQRRKVRKPSSVITKHHAHRVTPLMSINVSVYQTRRIRNHRKHEVGSTRCKIQPLMSIVLNLQSFPHCLQTTMNFSYT